MIEDLWKTLQSTNEWVRFSESKAAALLATQGVFVAVLSQKLLEENLSIDAVEALILGVALFFNCISMWFAFACINPSLKVVEGVTPIYFGAIAESFDSSQKYYDYYCRSMGSKQGVMEELCSQIYINSKIAKSKYKYVAFSLRLLGVSVSAWVVLVLLRVL